MSEESAVKCWEYFKCDKTDCPAHGSDETRCWLIPGTLCRDEIAGTYLEKIESCADCEVFKANVGGDEKTLKFIAEQFRAYHDKVVNEYKAAMQELANPVLQIWDSVVVLPLVGMIDSVRAGWMREALLEGAVKTGASVVIIDITGVPMLDAEAAEELVKTLQAVKMLGATGVLVGISPDISQTLVSMGVDLSGVNTRSTLRRGLEEAFRLTGLRVVRDQSY